MRFSKTLVIPIVGVLLLGACSGDDEATPPGDTSEPGALSVYTAPQLEDMVTLVIDAYEAENPDAKIDIVTEDLNEITDSIANAVADVGVVPDLWLSGVDGDLETGSFGRNLAVIAVVAGNPSGVADATAFATDSGLDTAICGPDTEFGNFSLMVVINAGIEPDPDTVGSGCEDDVLQQVANGELDAALMFRNGLAVPEGVELIEIDEEDNMIFDLSYVIPGESPEAADFGDFLGSDTVHALLTENGYLP